MVVDEVHAFAGDDRGWHLLAVLERLTRLVGRPIQRIGLSATVGNPEELLHWLQGSGPQPVPRPDRTGPAAVASPPPRSEQPSRPGQPPHPASRRRPATSNWTTSARWRTPPRSSPRCTRARSGWSSASPARRVEELGQLLRDWASPRSCPTPRCQRDERRRCRGGLRRGPGLRHRLHQHPGTRASTSATWTGSSRSTHRRRSRRSCNDSAGPGADPASIRNCLFLTVDSESLLQAAALLSLWGRGWVEPVVTPPEPRHIVAQQILALCLQEHRVGDQMWQRCWNGLEPFDPRRRADRPVPGREQVPRPATAACCSSGQPRN